MKQKWIIIIPLVLAMLLVCAVIAGTLLFAIRGFSLSGLNMPVLGDMRFSAEAKEEKTFEVKTPAALEVRNFAGFVHVQRGTGSTIDVTMKKKANGISQQAAQENLKRINTSITQAGNTVTVDVKLEPNTVNWSGSVDFTITVPQETAVDIQSATGDLSLNGTKGDAKLQTSFGSAVVENVQGALTVTTSSGRVEARSIEAGTANVELSSEFGEVAATGISGSKVTIHSNNGELTLNDITSNGLTDIRSEFGPVNFNQGSADVLQIRTQNGEINLTDLKVKGSATVSSDFGGITLTGVAASSYDLRTLNGQIKLDGASGPIKASSDFGPVDVKNSRDAVLDLKSNNGSLTFEGSLGKGPHTLHSQFGAVTLRLPAKTAFNFDLKTDFGKITSAFDMTMQGALEEKHWTGKVNGGGDLITVTTDNGNISLEISQ